MHVTKAKTKHACRLPYSMHVRTNHFVMIVLIHYIMLFKNNKMASTEFKLYGKYIKILVNFPTPEKKTLDLILTSLPGQFQEVHSPDKPSDHDIVGGILNLVVPLRKKPRQKVYLYQNGGFDTTRRDSSNFANDKYFSGHSGSRSFQENFNLIISFTHEAVDKYIPSKTSRSVASVPWITSEIRRNIRKRNKIKRMQRQKRLIAINSDLSFRNWDSKSMLISRNSMICMWIRGRVNK